MNIQILGLLIAKIALNEAQTDDNVETLAMFVTLFEVILASAPSLQAGAVLFFSVVLIIVIHFSDVGKSDFYFQGMIAMTLFFIAFGYPVAFVANLIGIVFIRVLKENGSYNRYT